MQLNSTALRILGLFFLLFFTWSIPDSLFGQAQLIVKNAHEDCGSVFEVEIYVNNFQDVSGVQFTIEFDAGALDYLGYVDEFPSGTSTLGAGMAGQGLLTFEWSSASAETLADGTVVLVLEFEHIGSCEESFVVHIIDEPMSIEISGPGATSPPLVFGAVFLIEGACPIDVDAGEDQIICGGGELALTAVVEGPVYDHIWEPEQLVNFPGLLAVTATVVEDTEFLFTGRAIDHNMVYNSHLDYGYAGFYTDYEYDEEDISNGNGIAVANSPDVVYSNFPLCTDHTGNNGNMIIVNGIDAPPQNVWCQYIEVEEDKEYLIEAYTDILVPFLNPASLQFFINGDAVGGTFEPDGLPCIGEWTHMEASWFSGSETFIELCIYNHTGNVGLGNAFILDDIAMYPLCEVTDTLMVLVEDDYEQWIEEVICEGEEGIEIGGVLYSETGSYSIVLESQAGCDSIIHLDLSLIEMDPVIAPPGILTCEQVELILDASAAGPANHVLYEWTSPDGNFTSPQDSSVVSVDEPGTYILQMTYDDGQVVCTSEEVLVTVVEDVEAPEVVITGNSEIDCSEDSFQLFADVSSPGSFDFFWETDGGNIVGSAINQEVTIDQAGFYLVEVTNSLNGCTAIVGFEVDESDDVPTAHAGENLIWYCTDSLVWLDGSSSDLGENFQYQWNAIQGGSILSASDSFTVAVDGPGMYVLEVTDTDNQCSSVDTVKVYNIEELVEFVPLEPDTINCINREIEIGFALSPDSFEFTLLWTAVDGDLLSNPDSSTVSVGRGGIYTLEVIFTEFGCSITREFTVAEDREAPLADAGPDQLIDCDDSGVHLDGSGSEGGASLSIEWGSANGNIVGGQSTLSPEVDRAGRYFLTLTNTNNGCFSTDSVDVIPVGNFPVIEFAGDRVLDCRSDSMLHVSAEVFPDSLTPVYQWSSSDGNIISPLDSSSIIVNGVGTYTLEVYFEENQCLAIAHWEVVEDISPPQFSLRDSVELNCAMPFAEVTVHSNLPPDLFSVEWTGPEGGIEGSVTDSSAVLTSGGYYFVELTDELNGCNQTDSIWVGENFQVPEFSIKKSGELDCYSEEVVLEVEFADFQAAVEFYWTTDDGNVISDENQAEITVDSQGLYFLSVTDTENQCSAVDSVMVENNRVFPEVHVGDDRTINCRDSSLILEAYIDSPADGHLVYYWETAEGVIVEGDSSFTPTVNRPGTYYLVVTDSNNGCSTTEEVVVLADTISPVYSIVGIEQLTCDVKSIELEVIPQNTSDFKVEWKSEWGEDLMVDEGAKVLIDRAGEYELTMIDLTNFCHSVESITIEKDTLRPESTIFCPDCDRECLLFPMFLDGSMSNSASGQHLFTWQGDGHWESYDSAKIQLYEPGSYQLIVRDEVNGCEDTSSIFIEELFLDDPLFEVNHIDCNRPFGTIEFLNGGNETVEYSIDGGMEFVETNVFENLNPAFYELVVRDATGCVSDRLPLILEDQRVDITVELPEEVRLSVGETFVLKPSFFPPEIEIINYNWSPSEFLDCRDCPNPIFTAISGETTIELQVETPGGCLGKFSVTFKVEAIDESYFIPTAFSPNLDGINDRMTIYTSPVIEKIHVMSIYNRWGERVFYRADFPPNENDYGWDGTYGGEEAEPGIYVIKVRLRSVDGSLITTAGEFLLIR